MRNGFPSKNWRSYPPYKVLFSRSENMMCIYPSRTIEVKMTHRTVGIAIKYLGELTTFFSTYN
jgi:hypothetical protein